MCDKLGLCEMHAGGRKGALNYYYIILFFRYQSADKSLVTKNTLSLNKVFVKRTPLVENTKVAGYSLDK